LRSLIEKERKFMVCSQATDFPKTLPQIRRSGAQVAIVTKDFVGAAAMKALEQIQALQPPVSVVFVSMTDDAASAAFTLGTGARGFLTKSTSGQIIEALKRVAAGQIFVAGVGSADVRKTDSAARAAELLKRTRAGDFRFGWTGTQYSRDCKAFGFLKEKGRGISAPVTKRHTASTAPWQSLV
jgi:DNA-binding NarL/FixJ family response regulator